MNHIVELNEMNEREERKRLILRIEKRNDCFEREIECVVYEMRKEIKNQTHSCISHQMKVVNVGLEVNKLRQD